MAGLTFVYRQAMFEIGRKQVALHTDVLKVALLSICGNAGADQNGDKNANSANYTDSPKSWTELTSGGGYTVGGKTLTGVGWTRYTSALCLHADNPTWTAFTKPNVAGVQIRDDTHSTKLLLVQLEYPVPQDGDGGTFEVEFPEPGPTGGIAYWTVHNV